MNTDKFRINILSTIIISVITLILKINDELAWNLALLKKVHKISSLIKISIIIPNLDFGDKFSVIHLTFGSNLFSLCLFDCIPFS